MNVFAVQKTYLLISTNFQSNKREKTETLRLSINISPRRISLNVKFPIPTKTLESCSHFLAFLINHLV